jgi:hypothetical protein
LIAVDTNILIYAHREDSPWHKAAYRCIVQLSEGVLSWAIPWPCIHEFLAIVTHPNIYDPPTPLRIAIEQVEAWMESPTLVLLSETNEHWKTLKNFLTKGKILGAQVYDARVAALCKQHGITELWTVDRASAHTKE